MHLPREGSEAVDEALGALLLRQGKLERAGLERALKLRRTGATPLHVLLAQLGLVAEAALAAALAEVLELPLVEPSDYPDAPPLDSHLSLNFLRAARVLPLGESDRGIRLAMADPLDTYALQAVRLNLGRPVLPAVAVPAELDAAMDRLFGESRSIGEIVRTVDAEADEEVGDDIEHLRDLASEAPVVRLVNLLIGRAVEAGASDIHIEPFEHRLSVRYRVDGVLRSVEAPPRRFRAAIISRIKILANLDIAERRRPQDGRIKLVVRGKEVDLRVSTVPTLHGEKLGLRILDRSSVVLDFGALGFAGPLLTDLQAILDRPGGILLVTGPTGSGKTTTLYAALQGLNTEDRNIVTVEDPIEYQIDGVNQIQVQPQIGLGFAALLRSILRQDPDVIMIGEIRDLETAEIAIQAALTGHLVLSTLHTSDAASTIARLLDMGVEDYLLTSTLSAVVAQRLVRTICPSCREPHRALPELVAQAGLNRFVGDSEVVLHRGRGCAECGASGYRGRTAIAEMLTLSEPLRRLVLKHADARRLQAAAVADGMRTIYESGVRKALAGTTTLEEVLRATRDV